MIPHYAVVNAQLSHRFGFGLIACCASFESSIQAKGTAGTETYERICRAPRYDLRTLYACVKVYFSRAN